MKKVLTLSAIMVLVLFTMTAIAQEDKTMNFGLKAGLNMANLTGDDVDDTKMLMGFGVGGFMEYMLSENFYLQPELLFMMKGAQEDGGDEDKLKLNYIEIPVLAKYKLSTEGDMAPYFFAGPVLSMLMSADLEGDDVKDSYKSMDFGIAFGAGVQFSQITVDARFTMGMSDIPDEGDYSMKNSNISLLVGYMF